MTADGDAATDRQEHRKIEYPNQGIRLRLLVDAFSPLSPSPSGRTQCARKAPDGAEKISVAPTRHPRPGWV